jgi:hypothetical protein
MVLFGGIVCLICSPVEQYHPNGKKLQMMVHGFGLTSLPHYIIQMAQKWHTYVTHVHAVCFQLKQWHRIKPWGCRMIVLFGNSACHSWKWLDCGRSAEIYRSSPSVPQAWLVNGSKWQSTMSHAWISGRPEGSDCSCPAITYSIPLYWLYWGCWAHEGLLNSAAHILKLLEALDSLDQMVPPGLFQASVLSSDLTDRQNFAFRAIVIPSDPGVLVLWPPVPDANANPVMNHYLVANLPRDTAWQGIPRDAGGCQKAGTPAFDLAHLAHKTRSCDYITSLHPVTLARLPLRVHWRIGYIPK